MNFQTIKIPKFIVAVYIVTQVFAYTLPFLDIIYQSGTFQQALIDFCYQVRNITWLLTIVAIVLYRRITPDGFLVTGFILLSYGLTYLIHPENVVYFGMFLPFLRYLLVAYLAVRAEFLEFCQIRKLLVWMSRILVPVLIITVVTYTQFSLSRSVYMDFSNAMSIGLALLVFSGLINKNIFDMVMAIAGMLVLCIYGSRGALLTLFVLFIYLFWQKYKNGNMMIVCIVIGVVIIFAGPSIISTVLVKVSGLGVNSRTIEKMLSGKFLVSKDRLSIFQYMISVIGNNFLLGTGIGGDRYYLPLKFSGTDASYAHNLILEILMDYGVLIGGLLISMLVYLIYKCFIKEKDIEVKAFLGAFFTIGFLQLMISRSWLTEPNFFIFFALLLTYSQSNRIRIVWYKTRYY